MSAVSIHIFILVLSCCTVMSGRWCACLQRNSRKIAAFPVTRTCNFTHLFGHGETVEFNHKIQIESECDNNCNVSCSHQTPIYSLPEFSPLPLTDVDSQSSTNTNPNQLLFNYLNNDLINDNTVSFLITSMAFHISKHLNFIGFYLPLQNSSNVKKFQRIVNYFGMFQKGIDYVNLEYITNNYDEVRENTLRLWDIINQENNARDTNTEYILEDLDTESIANLAILTKAQTTSNNSNSSQPFSAKYFWKTPNKWLSHKDQALEFTGLAAKDKPRQIKIQCYLLTIIMDRFYELITGSDVYNTVAPFNSRSFVLHAIRAERMFLNEYFRNEFTKINRVLPSLSMIMKLIRGTYAMTKSAVANRGIFVFNVLQVLSIAKQKQRVLDPDLNDQKFGVQIAPKLLPKDQELRFEIKFNAQIFSKQHSERLEQYFGHLIKHEALPKVKFNNLVDTGDRLLLFYVFLNFNIAGGSCGVEFKDNQTFVDTIFCQWPPYLLDDSDS